MIRFETILALLALQEKAGQPLHHLDGAVKLEGVTLQTLRRVGAVYTTMEEWYYSEGEANPAPDEMPLDWLADSITIPAGEVWGVRDGDFIARHTVRKYAELVEKGKLEKEWTTCTIIMEGESWRL